MAGRLAIRSATRGTFHSVVIVGLALAGVLASVVVFALDRASERESARVDLDRRVRERVDVLREKIISSGEVLHSIASLFHMRDSVPRADFARFVSDALRRQPELLALSWTPRVRLGDKANFEATARADGLTHFTLTERRGESGHYAPVADRPEYFPVYYIWPTAGNEPALGFDLHSDAVRAKTLDRARDTGLTLATPPLQLVQEAGGGMGFVVYLPLFTSGHLPPAAQRAEDLAGYTGAVYRIHDLVDPVFAGLNDGVEITIADRTDGDHRIYRRDTSAQANDLDPTLAAEAMLDLVGRKWAVQFTPTRQALAQSTTWRPWAGLALGLAMTSLVTAYVSTAVRQRIVVEHRVRERTLALSEEVAVRRQTEQQALLAEARYRSIFENCIEGIFQSTPDGRYISVNPALTRMYGYERPEELIRTLSDIGGQLYLDPNRRAEFAGTIQRDGIVTAFESQVRRRDGTVIWISENARAVRDADGRLLYYEGTVENISKRKLAESRLQQANAELEQRVQQRTHDLEQINHAMQQEIAIRKRAEAAAEEANRAKSVFLANVSHEIRTPMNAVVGYAQLLRRDPATLTHQTAALDAIVAGGDHLLRLIEELIDMSRLEAEPTDRPMTNVDLRQLADEIASLFGHRASEKNLALRVEASPSMPVQADAGKLRQVLINLVGNAVKYTDCGHVTLSINPAEDGAFLFEVTDTGVGIAADRLASIFEPFTQGQDGPERGGSGLGLSIARRDVRRMGGELAVESDVGHGSRFYFTLTLSPALPASAVRADDVRPFTRHIRVVVVDDVAENRTVLCQMLQTLGCVATAAPTAAEAIRICTSRDTDLVLTDILMDDMDGLAVAEAVRAVRPEMPVVAVTALLMTDPRVVDGPWNDVLAKPVRLQQLHGCIEKVLNLEPADDWPDAAPPPAAGDDPLPVIPSDLLARLLRSEAMGSVAEMKSCLADVAQQSPAAGAWAARVGAMLGRFDMEGIARELAMYRDQIADGAADDEPIEDAVSAEQPT